MDLNGLFKTEHVAVTQFCPRLCVAPLEQSHGIADFSIWCTAIYSNHLVNKLPTCRWFSYATYSRIWWFSISIVSVYQMVEIWWFLPVDLAAQCLHAGSDWPTCWGGVKWLSSPHRLVGIGPNDSWHKDHWKTIAYYHKYAVYTCKGFVY